MKLPVVPSVIVACLLFAGPLSAAVAQESAPGAWDGVWAPEPRGPGRPGGPQRGGPAASSEQGATFRLGGPPPGGGGRFNRDGGAQVSEADAAKGLQPVDMRIRRMMTPEGRAKFDQFDPLDLPSANCQTAGLPGIAVIPELQEWTLTGSGLSIRHESYDVDRVVSLGGNTPPAGEAHSVLGFATGSMSGDTLVIDTTNLAAGWGGLGRNAPGSDERTVRETYRMVDANTIEGEIVLSDPLYLTRELRIPVVLKRQPEGTTIESFPCDVEVARRHLVN